MDSFYLHAANNSSNLLSSVGVLTKLVVEVKSEAAPNEVVVEAWLNVPSLHHQSAALKPNVPVPVIQVFVNLAGQVNLLKIVVSPVVAFAA